MTKGEARALVRARERALSPAALAASSEALTRRFLALPEYRAAGTVMAYVSVGAEPDTAAILRRVLAEGKRLALPLVTGPGLMEARLVRNLDELGPGAYGIPEPPADAPLVLPEELDLILVPGAAFDEKRRRLGRGGGFYDRFLPRTAAFTVALTREALLFGEVPWEPHDVQVRYLLTEERELC